MRMTIHLMTSDCDVFARLIEVPDELPKQLDYVHLQTPGGDASALVSDIITDSEGNTHMFAQTLLSTYAIGPGWYQHQIRKGDSGY